MLGATSSGQRQILCSQNCDNIARAHTGIHTGAKHAETLRAAPREHHAT